jgi:hypothetical protein
MACAKINEDSILIVVAHMGEDSNEDFSFTLNVKPNDTMSMVKEKMKNHFEQEGETLQYMFFAGQLLDEDGTLSDYNIQKHDVVLISDLDMLQDHNTSDCVKVVCFDNYSFGIDAEASDSIDKVKAEIYEIFEADPMELYFGGKLLEEGTLSDYGFVASKHLLSVKALFFVNGTTSNLSLKFMFDYVLNFIKLHVL